MKIKISICQDDGWHIDCFDVPSGSDIECYRLPKINGEAASRAEFWSKKTGVPLHDGRALMWEVVKQ